MTERRNCSNYEKKSSCELKNSKSTVTISEAFITEDHLKLYRPGYRPQNRPSVPTVQDTILIPNQANVKPLIPTVNETVLLDKQCNKILSTKQEIDTKLNESIEKQNSDNTKATSANLFIVKKKKERAEKNKLDLLQKKKFLEDKKKRLDQLQKTTRELAKSNKKSKKQKTIDVDNENKSLPVETYQSKSEIKIIDQTWSPPRSPILTLPKSFKKAQKTPIKVQSMLKNSTSTDRNGYSDVAKNITKTASSYSHSIPQSSLIEKSSHLREVTKPENIYSTLKLNERYLLTDNNTYDLLTPTIIYDDSLLAHKDNNNVKLNEKMCHDNEILKKKDISLNIKMSDINLHQINSTNVNTETPTDLQPPDEYDEKMHCFNVNKELFSDNLLPNKTTQTGNCSNLLLVSSESSPPIKLKSVLECKNSLLPGEKNDFKLYKPVANLFTNGVLTSSNKHANENNMNDVESTVLNRLDLEYSDEVKHVSNLNLIETENHVNANKFVFTNENMNSSVNTYKDIKQVMKKINWDLEFFTKNNSSHTSDKIITCEHFQFGNISNSDLISKNNNSNKNDLCYHDYLKLGEKSSTISPLPSLSNLHDEFQAELNMLDQLNDSLRSIEKMDCGSSIKNNKQSIDDEPIVLNSSNDLNTKTVLNSSHSNDIPKYCSKLNVLSSSMMSIDKTITNFSILMFEQLIKDEKLKAKQHIAINSLREKSLANQLTWEATMCDLQATFRNSKNSLGHLHEFQIFKQQHRGKLKKLENSLSQVKRLGRVIDSVYKRRIIMLEEHLQYLRMQSSSKKVIRKLNSLDHIPKKEKIMSETLNTHIFNKPDKTDSIDIVESKTVHKNYSEPSISFENNTSPTVYQIENKIILRNQATSPINVATENFKPVDNNQVQTDVENSYIDKSVQTSNTSFCCSDNFIKNRKLSDPIDNLSYRNELSGVNNIITNNNDNKAVSSIFSTSPIKMKRCFSESSISTNSEQGEMDVRITTLQEQLEARKIESSRLKKKQKKLKLESLKAKEQEILKQIEMYDKRIEESRRSLMVEIEKKSVQLKNSSIKHDSSSKHSTIDVQIQNINTENKCTLAQHSQNVSDKIKYNNCCVPQDKLMCELQQKVTAELKENLSRFADNNFNSEISNNCKHKNHSLQYLETNQVNEVVSLLTTEVDLSRKCINDQSKEDIALLNPQSEEVLTRHVLNDYENNLRPKTCSSELNELLNTCDRPEKSTHFEKFTTSCDNMNDDHLNTNSLKNCIFQKKLFLDPNKTDVHEEINYGTSQLEASNNETNLRSVDDNGPGFTSDGNSPEPQESYKILVDNDNSINVHSDQDNESSYEEDRSEGDEMFEDRTFIEQYPICNDSFQVEKVSDGKVDVITNNIFNSLIEDMKNIIKINKRKPLSVMANNELNNLTEETPLLMILKREEEHQNMIILSEQAKSISDVLLKRNLQQILYESLQMYLPNLNETEVEKLKLYLNWSASRKKVKLSDYLKCQYKSNNIVDSDESFKTFYQKHQNQKTSLIFQDESSDVTLTIQNVDKLKHERSFVKEKIERLSMADESKVFLREIPNKPPPPYKSPTKKKALDDMPYSFDEVRATVLTAAGHLFRDPQSSMTKDYMNNLNSNLHVDYKTLLFDYCKEIAQDMFFEEERVPIWKKPKKKLKHFRGRPKNPEELCDVVIKKLNQIKDVDDCEEKVNAFVIKQMYEEDSKWVDFQMDEMNVQNDVVHSLMNKLICDTVNNMKTNFCLKFM